MTIDRTSRCPVRATTAQHAVIDRSAGIRRVGYPYLVGLRRRWSANSLEIRLLGRRSTVVSGAAGARLFYDEGVMQRDGAVPRPLRHTLFGDGAVHGLDGAQHRHRKAMFVELLTPQAAAQVARRAAELWQSGSRRTGPAAVFDEAVKVHCDAVCDWAGLPAEDRPDSLPADLISMVDGFGSLGRRHLLARRARRRADRWATELVQSTRAGVTHPPMGSALAVVSGHRGLDGRLLAPRVAGVELLNLLRPTVAVAYFVAFTAHALQTQPGLRACVQEADDDGLESIAHEVRRRYPFVPMLAARVRRPTEFQGRTLPAGRRVILDVYGMLHDPQLWLEPERFDPERFRDEQPDEYLFVPQGGGEPMGHRCPGERIAIELIKAAAQFLVERPAASERVHIPMNRMPTRPFAD